MMSYIKHRCLLSICGFQGQFCLHFFFYFLPHVTISYRQMLRSKMLQKGMTISTISADFTNLISNHLRILSSHNEHRISDAEL